MPELTYAVRVVIPGDRTLKYMARFACIGAECEDNCCHSWQVEVDRVTWDRLIAVTRLTSEVERKRLRRSTRVVARDGHKRRYITLRPDGLCPMLDERGLCHIHGTFGEKLLPDVCAVFPRSTQQIGDEVELSGMPSCPEVARQLLLHDDAIEVVPLPPGKLPRKVRSGGMDPRDIRPYWRLMLEVRTFLLRLLTDEAHTLEQRLFFMTWFAKRTAPILNKKVMKADPEAVRAEMRLLDEPATRAEVAGRFDKLDPPSHLVLLLARELVAAAPHARDRFRALVDEVFGSYVTMRDALSESPKAVSLERVWEAYRERRATLRARHGARLDQFLRNGAYNFWMQHLPLGSPDLEVHMLRMLAHQAVQKFLIVSHPRAEAAIDQVAVEVFYKTARHIEHTPLLTNLEKALEARQLRSLAGAVFLIRF